MPTSATDDATLIIEPIPAYTDNYIWLLYRQGQQGCWVVDPGDAPPVLSVLESKSLHLEGVMLTHHHGDHDGGIPELKKHFPGLRVITGSNSQSAHGTESHADGDRLNILGLTWQVIDVPGHTLDHVAFYQADSGTLFCGDTLFAGGCGRVFEGTPAQMYQSLQKLAALPADTGVYCAHEYTEANLCFAKAVEPDNPELKQRVQQTAQLRQQSRPTVPSQLADELATNPFLRCQQPGVISAANHHQGSSNDLTSGAEVFAAIRGWKDAF